MPAPSWDARLGMLIRPLLASLVMASLCYAFTPVPAANEPITLVICRVLHPPERPRAEAVDLAGVRSAQGNEPVRRAVLCGSAVQPVLPGEDVPAERGNSSDGGSTCVPSLRMSIPGFHRGLRLEGSMRFTPIMTLARSTVILFPH